MVVVNLYPFEAGHGAARDARSPRRSRTSTSAARRWCARRRRTTPTSRCWSIPTTTTAVHRRARSATAACRRRPTAGSRRRPSRPRRATTARSPTTSAARDRRRSRSAPTARLVGVKVQDLRYGENPHQRAAFYRDATPVDEPSVTSARQLQGKELSFNNLVDANAALELVKEFRVPAAVAIKHMNPCGVAHRARAGRGVHARRAPPIRCRSSAASSPSIASSTARPPRRCRISFSRS